MMNLNAEITASNESGIDGIIARIIADNALSIAAKNKLTSEAFGNIVRRSLGRTGVTLMRTMKDGIIKGTGVVAPRRVYTKTGVDISQMIKNFPPQEGRSTAQILKAWSKFATQKTKPVGYGFATKMRYSMEDNVSEQALEVGLQPKAKDNSWKDLFAEWQESGPVKPNKSAGGSMRGYFGALGMPLKAGTRPKRPARQIISNTQRDENPEKMFEKFFLERLLK